MSDWIPRTQGRVLAWYTRMIHRTAPLSVEGWKHLDAALAAQRPIIFANWHGQVHLFYATYATHFDLKDVYMIMVGDDRQGVLGYFAQFMDAHALPVDMGDASMAAARNLREMIKKLEPGKFSYIAPDGPDGPARVAKPGVAFIARQANALLVPVGNASRRALHLNRWDRYWLPLPYDRIYTVFGPAIDTSLGKSREEVIRELSDALNRLDAHAISLAEAT